MSLRSRIMKESPETCRDCLPKRYVRPTDGEFENSGEVQLCPSHSDMARKIGELQNREAGWSKDYDSLAKKLDAADRRIEELERLKDACVIVMPDAPEDRESYTVWLESKIKQLQAREQLVHEQGRGYAEPKLENRKLRAEVEQLTKDRDAAHDYLGGLLRSRHPDINLLDTLTGIATQIDNVFAVGLNRAEAEVRLLREALRDADDVLSRYSHTAGDGTRGGMVMEKIEQALTPPAEKPVAAQCTEYFDNPLSEDELNGKLEGGN